MEELEITARTVEQAIIEAERQLGIGRDHLEITVIRNGRTGIFGVGAEEAVVRVKPLASSENDVAQVATEVLETLLKLMGTTGKIQVSSDNISIVLNIDGDDSGILIGRHGQTLASLEYITRLIVAGKLRAWLPLSIDVSEYRKHRYDSLNKLALHLAEQVKSKQHAMTLEPMPADERRVIHLALANHPDVTTHSIGEGENRKVVILLKRD